MFLVLNFDQFTNFWFRVFTFIQRNSIQKINWQFQSISQLYRWNVDIKIIIKRALQETGFNLLILYMAYKRFLLKQFKENVNETFFRSHLSTLFGYTNLLPYKERCFFFLLIYSKRQQYYFYSTETLGIRWTI